MDVLALQEMIAYEEQAFKAGISAAALMEAAGEAMAGRILAIYPRAENFLVLAGKGNNGGDGLAVARHLKNAGKDVRIVLTAPENKLGELPLAQLSRLHETFTDLIIASSLDEIDFPGSEGVVIDALLGIQARGPLRKDVAYAVARLNAARASRFFRTVALDLPTGLAAYEEGAAPQEQDAAVVADVTIAVGFAKNVLVREDLAAWVGRLEVVAWSQIQTQITARQVLVPQELAGLLPRRSALSHKGDFGKLTIIAGSSGFTGAPTLCAQGALAMGAGLLSVVTRSGATPIVATQTPPEAMVSAWPRGKMPDVVKNATAIVIGPGLDVDAETVRLLRLVLSVGCPVLIDADGLNALAHDPNLLSAAQGPVLLTPHPGEMARLIRRRFEVEERESVAREFVEKNNVTLVLKGTRTIITAPGQPLFFNTTGNPGLSTGGSGDTLSGILGSLIAQGLSLLDAARMGVWLHGHAADLVLAERGCEEGLTPTMLSAHLGAALVSLRAQAITPPGLIERCMVNR